MRKSDYLMSLKDSDEDSQDAGDNERVEKLLHDISDRKSKKDRDDLA